LSLASPEILKYLKKIRDNKLFLEVMYVGFEALKAVKYSATECEAV
jgi:hypothetical protein